MRLARAARCHSRSDGATASGRSASDGSIDHGSACSSPVGTSTSGRCSPMPERRDQQRVEPLRRRSRTMSAIASAARDPGRAVARLRRLKRSYATSLSTARLVAEPVQPRPPAGDRHRVQLAVEREELHERPLARATP